MFLKLRDNWRLVSSWKRVLGNRTTWLTFTDSFENPNRRHHALSGPVEIQHPASTSRLDPAHVSSTKHGGPLILAVPTRLESRTTADTRTKGSTDVDPNAGIYKNKHYNKRRSESSSDDDNDNNDKTDRKRKDSLSDDDEDRGHFMPSTDSSSTSDSDDSRKTRKKKKKKKKKKKNKKDKANYGRIDEQWVRGKGGTSEVQFESVKKNLRLKSGETLVDWIHRVRKRSQHWGWSVRRYTTTLLRCWTGSDGKTDTWRWIKGAVRAEPRLFKCDALAERALLLKYGRRNAAVHFAHSLTTKIQPSGTTCDEWTNRMLEEAESSRRWTPNAGVSSRRMAGIILDGFTNAQAIFLRESKFGSSSITPITVAEVEDLAANADRMTKAGLQIGYSGSRERDGHGRHSRKQRHSPPYENEAEAVSKPSVNLIGGNSYSQNYNRQSGYSTDSSENDEFSSARVSFREDEDYHEDDSSSVWSLRPVIHRCFALQARYLFGHAKDRVNLIVQNQHNEEVRRDKQHLPTRQRETNPELMMDIMTREPVPRGPGARCIFFACTGKCRKQSSGCTFSHEPRNKTICPLDGNCPIDGFCPNTHTSGQYSIRVWNRSIQNYRRITLKDIISTWSPYFVSKIKGKSRDHKN